MLQQRGRENFKHHLPLSSCQNVCNLYYLIASLSLKKHHGARHKLRLFLSQFEKTYQNNEEPVSFLTELKFG